MQKITALAGDMIHQELVPYYEDMGKKMKWMPHYNFYRLNDITDELFNLEEFFTKKNILNIYDNESIVNFLVALSNDWMFYQVALQRDEKNLLAHLYDKPFILEPYIIEQSTYKNYIGRFVDVERLSETQQKSIIDGIIQKEEFKKIEIKAFLKKSIDEHFIHPEQYSQHFNIKINQGCESLVETPKSVHLQWTLEDLYLVNLNKEYRKEMLEEITLKVLKQIQKIQDRLGVNYSLLTQDNDKIGLLMVAPNRASLNEKFLKLAIDNYLNSVLAMNNMDIKTLNQFIKKLTPQYLDKMRLELALSDEPSQGKKTAKTRKI